MDRPELMSTQVYHNQTRRSESLNSRRRCAWTKTRVKRSLDDGGLAQSRVTFIVKRGVCGLFK